MEKSYECEVATHFAPSHAEPPDGARTHDRAEPERPRPLGSWRLLSTGWLSWPNVCHPYPLRRMGVVT
jgi:hypothetical protein